LKTGNVECSIASNAKEIEVGFSRA
jgi:hypothetical protein